MNTFENNNIVEIHGCIRIYTGGELVDYTATGPGGTQLSERKTARRTSPAPVE